MTTKPGVFILESNKLAEETKDLWEGRALRDILRLLKRRVQYRYFRTRKELIALLKEFERSQLRYLHLACHGNRDVVALTLDSLSVREFGRIAAPYLHGRRLFISACWFTALELARSLFGRSRLWCVAGPVARIDFADTTGGMGRLLQPGVSRWRSLSTRMRQLGHEFSGGAAPS